MRATRIDVCDVQCFLNHDCVSYNFGPSDTNDNSNICQLNNSTDRNRLKPKAMYTYVETENACKSTPCLNNGKCQYGFTDKTYRCLCSDGFEGELCEKDVDDCASVRCQNGGCCIDKVNGFNCSCQPGFNGSHCEIDVDECTSNPCLNNGTCVNRVNGFNCSCAPGFNGTYCDTAKKGSKSSVPGSSCEDILISGASEGDGEYWINPTDSGNLFTVFCDMSTDKGGWTLIGRFLMRDANSIQDATVNSESYREILPNYNSNYQFLLRNGFNQLKSDMGFTQIRFYCFKKKRGKVFHIMTNKDAKGTNAVKFFTTSDTMPQACDSFTRLPDDNSALANKCCDWGWQPTNRWGHPSNLNDKRLYTRPILWAYKRYFSFSGDNLSCDDNTDDLAMSIGDIWQIFVR
ncbi:hypothetical protein ACROYT_G029961 [Oculina patagonica]